MADKTNRPSDAQLLQRKAAFIQHSLPGLEAGKYRISAQQAFADSEGKPIDGEGLPEISYDFGVQGPRYSLPQDTVLSVYPPADAAGGFSNSIAHVVMTREKLPWIRTPYLPGNEPVAEARKYTVEYGGKSRDVTYDQDKATWLAVLLITPDDIGGQDPVRLITNGQAADMVPDALTVTSENGQAVPGKMPADRHSLFSYALKPEFKPANGQVSAGVGLTAETNCTYIDVPAKLFDTLAPSLDDLQMMAHVRAVQMDAKPIADGDSSEMEERYSIVVGNRLPQTMPQSEIPPVPQKDPAVGRNVAFLVSLENMQDTLRGHAATGPYAAISQNPDGQVRLIVLHSWSFVSWQDTAFDFEYLLKSLNGRDASLPNKDENVAHPRMRLPDQPDFGANPTEVQTLVSDMMGLGHAPMNHLTRVPDVTGDEKQEIQTVSWYRGPLAPFETDLKLQFLKAAGGDDDTPVPLVFSADQLLQFDPEAGMYDVSYAAAWQLGQLVSLQDKSFSVALYRWKKNVDQMYRTALEAEVLKTSNLALMGGAQYFSALANTAEKSSGDGTKPAASGAAPTVYEGVMGFLAKPRQQE